MDTKLYNTIMLVCFGIVVLAIIGTVAFPYTIAPLFMGAVGTTIAVVAAMVNRSIIAAENGERDD